MNRLRHLGFGPNSFKDARVGLKLLRNESALDLSCPVPGGAGVDAEPSERSAEVELRACISKQAELGVNNFSGDGQFLSRSGCEFAAERRSVGMVIV